MTQCERILRHLRDYGIMRLASRISDLKKAGMPIKAETVTGKNRYGERTSFARYSMAEGGNDG